MLRLSVLGPLVLALGLLASAPADPSGTPPTGTIVGAVHDAQGDPLPGASVRIAALNLGTSTGIDGRYRLENVPEGTHTLRFDFVGFQAAERSVTVVAGQTLEENARMEEGVQLEGVTVDGYSTREEMDMGATSTLQGRAPGIRIRQQGIYEGWRPNQPPPVDREEYAPVEETGYHAVTDAPLSTFSIDVDAASYANLRRFLSEGRMPVPDAVRVEEMVNYFSYEHAGPEGDRPFAVHVESARAPWNPEHHLVQVALQAQRLDVESLPPSNLVFLVDVSGSMSQPNKLPLLVSGLQMLAENLRPQDRVALVVYAGAAGVVLEPTPGSEVQTITAALGRLRAGGSTAGGAGLQLAYDLARQHYDAGANNRVLIATDGDFNVGPSSTAEMRRLVERERESGVFLSVLGFGTGNLQDALMEEIAQYGNGNYNYIDSAREARKVLVDEMGGTLVALAKDVKIQVEFNPARVAGYRLIGYENRRLADEDFADDRVDAGEIGAGHAVVALYEVVPHGASTELPRVDSLRYQTPSVPSGDSPEWLTVALRYKPATAPGQFADESVRIEVPFVGRDRRMTEASRDLRWAASVAEAGLVFGRSDYAGTASLETALERARGAQGPDAHGYRAEFVRMLDGVLALQDDPKWQLTQAQAE